MPKALHHHDVISSGNKRLVIHILHVRTHSIYVISYLGGSDQSHVYILLSVQLQLFTYFFAQDQGISDYLLYGRDAKKCIPCQVDMDDELVRELCMTSIPAQELSERETGQLSVMEKIAR